MGVVVQRHGRPALRRRDVHPQPGDRRHLGHRDRGELGPGIRPGQRRGHAGQLRREQGDRGDREADRGRRSCASTSGTPPAAGCAWRTCRRSCGTCPAWRTRRSSRWPISAGRSSEHYGAPQDIEWAITGDGPGTDCRRRRRGADRSAAKPPGDRVVAPPGRARRGAQGPGRSTTCSTGCGCPGPTGEPDQRRRAGHPEPARLAPLRRAHAGNQPSSPCGCGAQPRAAGRRRRRSCPAGTARDPVRTRRRRPGAGRGRTARRRGPAHPRRRPWPGAAAGRRACGTSWPAARHLLPGTPARRAAVRRRRRERRARTPWSPSSRR